jgi:hypothetical protein
MTDEDVVRRLHRIIGIGTVIGPHIAGFCEDGRPYKAQWQWKIAAQEDVLNFCALLAPEMCERRAARMVECLNDLVAS